MRILSFLLVPRMMNQTAGNLIKQWCQEKGVTVHTSTKVEAIEQSGEQLKVKLDNGDVLDADIVISATGVKSNIQFLDGSDIETEFGVLVNDHLQTNYPDIYAAGDVCQGKVFSTGEYSVQAIQTTAADHNTWVNDLDVMLPKYYEVRGWTADGVPTNETRTRLGL